MRAAGLRARRPAAIAAPPIPDTPASTGLTCLARRFARGAAEHRLGDRYHLYLDPGGLAVPGGDLDLFSRRVVGWSMSERLDEAGTRRTAYGPGAAPSATAA